MKLTKLLKAAAALVVVATALAGCKFEGTKSDFKADARNGYISQNDAAPENAATISVSGSLLESYAQESIITVTITGKTQIDTKSAEKALDFYALSDAANATSVIVRGAKLPKTVKNIDTYKSGSNFVTQIYYTVDATGNGKKNKIAFVADAKSLKDKAGKLVLNGNGNEKLGEESDSYINSNITVSYYKEGDVRTATEALVGHTENFHPTFGFGAFSGWSAVTDDAGKETGALEASFGPVPYETVNGTDIYPQGFASELDKMYVLRYLPMGAKDWKESAVTGWAWNDTVKKYEVKTAAVLEYGTRYAFLEKSNNSVKWAEAEALYGHVPVISYEKDKKNFDETTIDTYTTVYAAPEWIVEIPDNSESATAATFPATGASYGRTAYFTTQDELLNCYWNNDNTVRIEIDSTYTNSAYDIRFDSFSDFIITDSKYNKLKIKAPVAYKADATGRVYQILITLEDKNIAHTGLRVWVGEGTTIKGNKLYPAQVKFGCPKIVDANDLIPGYVILTNN